MIGVPGNMMWAEEPTSNLKPVTISSVHTAPPTISRRSSTSTLRPAWAR